MGVFDHKDVKCNPEGMCLLLNNCPQPRYALGVPMVGGHQKDSKDSLLNNKDLLSHFLL